MMKLFRDLAYRLQYGRYPSKPPMIASGFGNLIQGAQHGPGGSNTWQCQFASKDTGATSRFLKPDQDKRIEEAFHSREKVFESLSSGHCATILLCVVCLEILHQSNSMNSLEAVAKSHRHFFKVTMMQAIWKNATNILI